MEDSTQAKTSGKWWQQLATAVAGLTALVVAFAELGTALTAFKLPSCKGSGDTQAVATPAPSLPAPIAPVQPPEQATGARRSPTSLLALARSPDQIDVFWIAANGSLETQHSAAGGQRQVKSGPGPITTAGAVMDGSNLAAVSRTADTLDVFWIDPDGAVRTLWWDAKDGTSWEGRKPMQVAPPGAAAKDSHVTAAVRAGDRLEVFWIGADRAIWRQWWGAGGGRDWTDHAASPITIAGAAAPGSQLTAVMRARDPEHLDVFWIKDDGAIASEWWDAAEGPDWQRHEPLAITPAGAAQAGANLTAISRKPGQVDLFWVAADGAVTMQWLYAPSGHNWKGDKPRAISDPAAAAAGSRVAVVSSASEQLEIFWIGTDGAIQTNWWTLLHNWTRTSQCLITQIGVAAKGSSVSASARTDTQRDVFWVGKDGTIARQWKGDAFGQGWSKPTSVSDEH